MRSEKSSLTIGFGSFSENKQLTLRMLRFAYWASVLKRKSEKFCVYEKKPFNICCSCSKNDYEHSQNSIEFRQDPVFSIQAKQTNVEVFLDEVSNILHKDSLALWRGRFATCPHGFTSVTIGLPSWTSRTVKLCHTLCPMHMYGRTLEFLFGM